MVFTAPSWVPNLPLDPPDSITIHEFMNNEAYGRRAFAKSRNPYTCGISGASYSPVQVKERTECLARAIAKRLGFQPNQDTEWDKVVAIYSVNTIDYIPVIHAIHRLSGIVTPASAANSVVELEHQLRTSHAKALFTCLPLLSQALQAARACGIPDDNVFILEVPGKFPEHPHATVNALVEQGRNLPPLPPLKWVPGQGARQVAFLCYSSGTSGLPKAVMISHRNVIANILQYTTFDSVPRKTLGIETQVGLGLLPFSHIYALVIVTHGSTFRGDEVVVLPRFELQTYLAAIERFKIEQLCLVPPILIAMIRNRDVCAKYNLDSVRYFYTGAAPMGPETADEIARLYPKIRIGQGYGMTETSTAVCSSNELDILVGSSGSVMPGTRIKIIGVDGKEITEYEKRGELLVQGPSVALGYLHNEKANAETFVWDDDGRWIKTGDEVIVRKAPSGNEHVVIVDRIKELIKVKGHQVAPAELEAHLLTHPAVEDCAVIQVPDDRAGELPRAYVVKSQSVKELADQEVSRIVCKHVEDHKARHKWLKGGVVFIDVVPKSPSGKILRRVLRDREREERRARGAKL